MMQLLTAVELLPKLQPTPPPEAPDSVILLKLIVQLLKMELTAPPPPYLPVLSRMRQLLSVQKAAPPPYQPAELPLNVQLLSVA